MHIKLFDADIVTSTEGRSIGGVRDKSAPTDVRRSIVMLSATKHLGQANEILRFAQDDTGWAIRLSLPDELMVQYIRTNGNELRLYF